MYFDSYYFKEYVILYAIHVRAYVRRSYQKINRLSRLVLFFYFDSVNNKNNILTTQPPRKS